MKVRLMHLLLGSTLATSPSLAQVTHLHFEASTDHGTTWASSVSATPGQEVSVRLRVRLDLAGTTRTSMGFGGITLQPTQTQWTRGDLTLPFARSLAPNAPGNAYGRVYPFGVASEIGIPPPYLFFDDGGVLRIADARNTKAPGRLAWGLNLAQYPLSLNTTGYNTSLDVVVFRYGFVAGHGTRTMLADAEPEWVNNKRGTWYTSPSGTGPLQASLTRDTIHPALIRIVPSPWTLACVGMLAVHRRRSRPRRTS